jgi:two-component system, chemotaxis family, sensor kinase CheA
MSMDDIDINELLESFSDESDEQIVIIEESLLAIEDNPDNDDLVEGIFRAAHTLKGNARIVGLDVIAEFTHSFEDVLDRMRRKSIGVTSDLVSLLLKFVDALRDIIPKALSGNTELSEDHLDLIRQISEKAALSEGGAKEQLNRKEEEIFENVPASMKNGRSQTLRVGIDKLDRIMNMVGEIAIARSRIVDMLESKDEYSHREILEAHHESDLSYMDLQEQVMKVRMVPVGPLFKEYNRMVRDLSMDCGKGVRLIVEDEDVEVDTTVVEHLRDPLTHLIRNAIHHGIEKPHRRTEMGKPPVGKITLQAHHEGGSIVVRVCDDGAGFKKENILKRATQMGLVDEDHVYSDQDIFALAFEPGFTTAEEVDEISGRGVGMDVVRKNVETLRGTISVENEEDGGATISMRLPLTLAIIDGFRVGVEDEIYVVPLDNVVECVELSKDEKEIRSGRGLINLRGKPVPFLNLRSYYGLGGKNPDRESIIILNHGGSEVGLAVDRLLGEGQTVIKPLNKIFKDVPGLAGSSILGNGQVAFIIDVPGLLNEVHRASTEAETDADQIEVRAQM